MKAVFIVAGHGMKNGRFDTGAISKDRSITEREIVVDVCKSVDSLFKDQLQYKCITIGVYEDIDLYAKTKKIDRIMIEEGWNDEDVVLVSVHADWYGSSYGTFGLYRDGSRESQRLSEIISRNIANEGGLRDKAERPDNFKYRTGLWILRQSDPIIETLIEIGSLGRHPDHDNDDDGISENGDVDKLKDEKIRYKIATGIVKGIEEYANVLILNDKTRSFKDVPNEQWFSEHVELVKKLGIMGGYPDGTFKGNMPVTRYEIATVASRLINYIDAQG